MAVTVTAALVKTLTADPARPAGHAGWNNPYGDPTWIADIDWYRRVQLEVTGSAGEVGSVVNWEITDSTIQMKTNADMATAKAGAVASPFGTTVNNKDTWTVWATTGVATAGADKYVDTKTACISTLRANGPRVQVLLGKKRLATGTTEVFNVAAFLPGGGKVPAGTASVTVQGPFAVGGIAVTMDEDDPLRVTFDLPDAPGETVWDFGDGTTDTQADDHTVHHYAEPGTYTVIASGGHGTTAHTTVVVEAAPEPPAKGAADDADEGEWPEQPPDELPEDAPEDADAQPEPEKKTSRRKR